MSIHFINNADKEFLSKKPFFKIVQRKRINSTIGQEPYLWFANPSTWEDAFERRFIDVLYKDNNGGLNIFPLKGRIFCTCFSLTRVCEAQWKVYSKNPNNICIKVNRGALLDELTKYLQANTNDEIYIGRVEYQETRMIKGSLSKNPLFKKTGFSFSNQASLVKLLTLKRNAFLYEDELRIFIIKPQNSNTNHLKGVEFHYQCKPTDLVESIMLNPSFKDKSLEQRLAEDTANGGYGFTPFVNSKGNMKRRVYKSQLYKYKHPSFIKL